jgi:hypothetical protein
MRKFAICVQPASPIESELTAWRIGSYPSRNAPSIKKATTKNGPAMAPLASSVFSVVEGPETPPSESELSAEGSGMSWLRLFELAE